MIISDLAIKNRISVFVLTAVIVVIGLSSYLSLPREAAPSITIPMVFVATPYFGVSPSDMENLVTQPIEKRLKELSNVKEISSTSSEGISTIVVEFEPDVNLDNALQKVRDKVDLARPDLPNDAEESSIQEINIENTPIMVINIAGTHSLVALKDIAEDLEERIETVSGVLDVVVTGGLEREVQVNVDPDRLKHYNLGLEDVIETIQVENLNMPGGSIDSESLRYLVRVPGEISSPDEIGRFVVESRNGQPITVEDVATVRFGFKEPASYARINGLPSVSLNIQKRSGENLIRIADSVKALLEEESARLPESVEFTILADQSKDIRRMVSDLENNIISGLILVIVVLFMFMGVRNAVFVAIAIPLSMLLSFVVIQAMGYTLNMVILFSLILALGMLVDNAIVVVENIYRHREEGLPLIQAARDGVGEVAGPVIASTLTTICAFGPMLFWPGIMGEFMGYLPATLIITLSCSLFVALVINPTVCSVFVTVDSKRQEQLWLKRFRNRYKDLLWWSLDHKVSVISITGATFIGMILLYSVVGRGVEFFPETEPNQAYIDITAATGTRLEVSDGIIREIEDSMGGVVDLTKYVSNVGSSPDPTDIGGGGGGGTPHKSRVIADFPDRQDRSRSSFETVEQIRGYLADLVGARVDIVIPQNGPPTGAPVNIELVGDDFRVLGRMAKEVNRRIKDIPGLVDLKSDYDTGRPELKVVIDRNQAAQLQVNTSKVARTVRTAINGTTASEFRIGEDEYDIVVRFAEQSRGTFADLERINILHEGEQIPLANLAQLEVAGGLGSIRRKDLERVVSVEGNVDGRLANEVLADIQAKLVDMELPSGYVLRYAGENVEQDEASAFLSNAFGVALMLILLVLITQFNSLTLPLIIMLSVIMSLIGVFLGLIVTATPFGIIMTGIGVISLAGVVVNNAIVLIDYIQKLRERGYSRREAIVHGGETRLRPVILTAITTILGLIPLSTGISFDFRTLGLELGGESSQWWGPMGVAVIFGLSVATILTLVVVPVMYEILMGWSDQRAAARSITDESAQPKSSDGSVAADALPN